jgi:hypothetical protein
MAWSDLVTALNESVFNTFGETATYQPAGGAAVTCRAVVSRSMEPVFAGGEVVIDEEHYTALIPATDITGTPAEGATLTVGSSSYRVELPGANDNGAWKLTLRKRT